MDQRVQGAAAGGCQADGPGTVEKAADLPSFLPDDVLADVLRRAAPRGLAAARCVCKAWRALIDGRRLLRAELLPLSLAGFFLNFDGLYITEFFSRASGEPCAFGKHDYLPGPVDPRIYCSRSWTLVRDHCNGLLLLDDDYVLNPATKYLAHLPPCPPSLLDKDCNLKNYLAYDPTLSPNHYEVFAIPRLPYKCGPGGFCYTSSMGELDPQVEQSEWPPCQCMMHVFSSTSGRWEERSLVRHGEAAGTIADMRLDYYMSIQRNAVYWRGELYATCQNDFVMRISLSENKYQVIKAPTDIERSYPYLGKSEKGVYLASIERKFRLRVWILNESCSGKMEWVLKHDRDLIEWLLKHRFDKYASSYDPKGPTPWISQDINDYYFKDCARHFRNIGAVSVEKFEGNLETTIDGINAWRSDSEDENTEALIEERFEWSSEALVDETSEWSSNNEDIHHYNGYIQILGFHPFKDIVFLSESRRRGLAYHLNSSKVEALGNVYPAGYDGLYDEEGIKSSFPYTPCLLGPVDKLL
ncbi:unnamed protein product [Urochloa decumbens]|uniref:F-box domain-containing protein n=1 Tax=Urochloa decumbens TaxID=240449 RepID=A0ABC8Y296_9POAL